MRTRTEAIVRDVCRYFCDLCEPDCRDLTVCGSSEVFVGNLENCFIKGCNMLEDIQRH